MANDNKRLTDEQLTEKACGVVDELTKAVKSASRDIFDALVERTKDVFSDVADKYAIKAKEKISGKGKCNDREKDIIS